MNNKEHQNKSQTMGLSYEPMGMPSERVLRLRQAEQRAEEKTEQETKPSVIKYQAKCPIDEIDIKSITTRISSKNSYDQNVHIRNLSQNTSKSSSDAFRYSRQRMVQEQLIARDISQEEVLYAMETVPRHLFVSEALHATAYDDRPLPIAEGQTISQPYVVALMCQLLMAKPKMSVLEVGTGSGYQATILYAMGLCVYSVERISELYHKTRPFLLKTLACHGMQLTLSDGTLGWEQHAPYDRIIVAAGGPTIPHALKAQLKDGGIMLIPVGAERKTQRIIRVSKTENTYREEDCGPVSFVDLVGSDGWK